MEKMVRKYVKKGLRQAWSDESMRAALDGVINKGLSIKKASAVHHVPHATLGRKVAQCRLDPEKQNELLANPKANFQTIFTREQENILCEYISELESAMVGLAGTDIRRIAFQLAEKFNIPHRFKKDSGQAGEEWYIRFLKRNPHVVKVRRGDTPYEKSKMFSKEKVYKFFDSLESLINKYNLKPSDLYNLDETVITCWARPVEEEDSEESDEDQEQNKKCGQNKLVTAMICYSASGVYTPMLMVFPDKAKHKPLLDGAPPSAWALVNASGQVQLDIFIRWLQKFIDFRKPTKSEPVLILFDGYHSYLKNIQVLEMMTENGVHVLCLPPHCSKKLQPSKHSYMNILSKTYRDEVANWTMNSGGQFVSADEVFKLLGDAFIKVSTTPTAANSFINSGIWPPNRDLFKDEFVTVTLKPPPGLNDSQSTSESSTSIIEEAYQEMKSNVPILNPIPVLHAPMIVISRNNNQSYDVQEGNQINQSYEHSVQQGHFLQIENEPMENVILPSDNQSSESSIVIPQEAQLTEVPIQDLQFLAQSQRKLYFYVSPNKLKLS